MLRVLSYSKEDTNKVKLLLELSIYQFQNKEHKAALLYADSALSLSKYLKWKTKEAQSYHLSANILMVTGKYAEAINSFKNAIKVRETMEDTQAKIDAFYCYIGIGRIWLDQDKPSEAVASFSTAFKLAEKHEIKGAMAYASSSLAHAYINLNDHKQAIVNYNLAINIYEDMNDSVSIAIINNDIGMLHIEQGNYAESLKSLLKGLKIFEMKNMVPNVASSLNRIGSVYNNLGNYPEAVRYQQAALQKANECGSKSLASRVYFELGKIYYNENNYNKSLENYSSALNEIKPAPWYAADIKHHIARVYIAQAAFLINEKDNQDSIIHKLEESIKIMHECKVVFEQDSARDGMAETYTDLGIAISRHTTVLNPPDAQERYEEALDYLNRALILATKIGLKKITKEIYHGLSETHDKIGNYKMALKYARYYSALKDTIYSSESLNRIGELRISFETEKVQASEKARQEKDMAEIKFLFEKREDSMKYHQQLTEASLDLSNKQQELNQLSYLKTEAELQAEQSMRLEKEKQLTIANQEKSLQNTQLNLQKTQLNLKENQIKAEKKQRLFYIGGIALLILLFLLIYRNIRNRQKTERLIATERLKTEKAHAAHTMAELELQSLRAQLNPHFMFNSLNAIQELILKEDNDNSHLYLSRFSDLLRMLLENANHPFVPLRKEINFLELYLSLENLRIPDLKYSIEVDPLIDSSRVMIPNMMLQPYIENAIWHGLSHKKENKNIYIRITKKESGVVCEVEDNGVGRKMATELKSLYRKEHRSRGMELLSKRFNLLSKEYGSDIRTIVEDLHDNGTATGTRVAITVPYSLTKQPEPVFS